AIGINHLGDWGTQFGKLIVAFRRWGNKQEIEQGGVRAMLEIYARFHEEAEKDESLNDEARAAFKAIEDGKPEALALFDWFRTLTLKEVQRVYDLLGVKFDSYAGESFYNDKMQPIVDELREKGLLELDDGASVVRFPEEDNMPPCLILRSDGATLYATRDIAAAFYRKSTYDFAKCLYVVAYQQNLHFKQVFKVIEMMGRDWAKDLVHVAFGMVSTADGTLSTRKGKVVFLEEVLKESIEKIKAIMMEKSPDLENMDQIAQDVGVGAIVFSTLSSARIKDIVFDWDRALNFEGETGPYCQYTHARCCSLLSRAGYDPAAEVDFSLITDAESVEVARLLHEFPAIVKSASEKYEPYLIARFVVDLAQAFNRFYLAHRILGEPREVQNARLALTACARQVIATGLRLLGIAAPEKM
ncbi:MAG: arginine--tRNA ligase, partial [Christensenellales bacterium]